MQFSFNYFRVRSHYTSFTYDIWEKCLRVACVSFEHTTHRLVVLVTREKKQFVYILLQWMKIIMCNEEVRQLSLRNILIFFLLKSSPWFSTQFIKKPQEGVSSHPIPRNANYLSFGWDITLFKCIRHTNNLLSFKYPKLFVFDIDF